MDEFDEDAVAMQLWGDGSDEVTLQPVEKEDESRLERNEIANHQQTSDVTEQPTREEQCDEDWREHPPEESIDYHIQQEQPFISNHRNTGKQELAISADLHQREEEVVEEQEEVVEEQEEVVVEQEEVVVEQEDQEEDQEANRDEEMHLTEEGLWSELSVEAPQEDISSPVIQEKDITALEKQVLLINELVFSETNYVEYVTLLLDLFINPIESRDEKWKRELMDFADVAVAFMYLRQIVTLNMEFRKQLSSFSSEEMQSEEEKLKRLHEFCSLMATFSIIFRLYAQYAAIFRGASDRLAMFEASNNTFEEFLSKQKLKASGNNLNSLMVMPIQRIPRYELFLSQIVTENDNPAVEAVLMDGLARVSTTTKFIEDAVSGSETRQELLNLQRRIRTRRRRGRVNLLSPSSKGARRLLKRGNLVKASKGGTKLETLEFFLFSDILMYSEARPGRDNATPNGSTAISQNERFVQRGKRPLSKASDALRVRRAFFADDLRLVKDDEQTRYLDIHELDPETDTEVSEEMAAWLQCVSDIPSTKDLRFFVQTPLKLLELYAASKQDRDDWVAKIVQVTTALGGQLMESMLSPSAASSPPSPADQLDSLPDESQHNVPEEHTRILDDVEFESYLERDVHEPSSATLVGQERFQAAENLLADESDYCGKLVVLTDVFARPLLDMIVEGTLKGSSSADNLSPAAHASLSSVDNILALHALLQLEILHQGVAEELESFSDTSVIERVLRLFHIMVPFVDIYLAFVQRSDTLLAVMQDEKLEHIKLALERDPKTNGAPFESFYKAATGRLAFYRNSIQELQRLSEGTEDQAFLAALATRLGQLDHKIEHIQEATTEKKNLDDLLRIEHALASFRFGVSEKIWGRRVPPIVHADRKLLFEGTLVKVCTHSKPSRCRVWLFNDILVYASKSFQHGKFRFRRLFRTADLFAFGNHHTSGSLRALQTSSESNEPLPAETAEQIATDQNDSVKNPFFDFNSGAFKLRTTTKSFILLADSVESRDTWVSALNSAAATSLGAPVPNANTFYAPILAPVRLTPNCMLCEKRFSSIKAVRNSTARHCSICGRLVCSACGRKRTYLRVKHGVVCSLCADIEELH